VSRVSILHIDQCFMRVDLEHVEIKERLSFTNGLYEVRERID
jgi:hypothetical protein